MRSKSRIDIVDLVSETVQLRRSGKNYIGFCPFHPNTRTPAFVVFPESGTWRCFGQCNEGGDIFRFVMKKEGWDFPEALRYLAEKAGVVLAAHDPRAPGRGGRARAPARPAGRGGHLLPLPPDANPGGHARAGLPGKARPDRSRRSKRFGLGYAPESWDTAPAPFHRKKATRQEELLEAGLVTERDRRRASTTASATASPSPSATTAGKHGRFWRAHPQPG